MVFGPGFSYKLGKFSSSKYNSGTKFHLRFQKKKVTMQLQYIYLKYNYTAVTIESISKTCDIF